MNPRIETMEPMHFVGVSDRFISIHSADANNFEVIPALWDRFHEVWAKVDDPVDHQCYGVIYTPDDQSRSDEFAYIAALRIPSARASDEKLTAHSTSAATYAVVEHRGPVAGIGNTLRDFHQWLEPSDYTLTDGAEIEVYPEEYDPTGASSVMETWFPVAPEN